MMYLIEAGHRRFENFRRIGFDAVVFIDITVNIEGTVCQTLRQMQFKIGEPPGFQAATKSVYGRLADAGFQREGRNA